MSDHQFHNSSDFCPAVAMTSAYQPVVDHIACYGPYLTGEGGVNISQALKDCCNSSAIVVRDEFYQTANRSNCFLYANVTRDPSAYFDTGAGFCMVEGCIRVHPANDDNRYNITCYPISHEMYPSSSTPAHRSLSVLGLSLVLFVATAVALG